MILPENRLSESYHLILSRRMATWIAFIYIFLFMGILFGFGISWLNSKMAILPKNLPMTIMELSFILGLLSVTLPSLYSLIFQPQIFDWTLNIYDTSDSLIKNEKLELLHRFSEIQRLDRGLLCRRVEVFLSDEISMNALTYGGFLKAPRVVFASDLFEQFSDAELQSIFCHELSHVHYGDFFINIGFHYLLRVFDFLFFPFRIINRIIQQLITFTFIIPFFGVLFRAFLYLISFAFAALTLPVWLVKALYSMQSQIREYVADDYAVRIMNNADGILTSLMKLENSQIKVFNPGAADKQSEEECSKEKAEEKESTPEIEKIEVKGEIEDGKSKTPLGDGKNEAETSQESISVPKKRPGIIETIKKKAKKSPIKGKYRRYATVAYEVELREPDTTIQKIYSFVKYINETHPPAELRWQRIARVGFQIDSEKEKGVT